jgi:hypothetical protein
MRTRACTRQDRRKNCASSWRGAANWATYFLRYSNYLALPASRRSSKSLATMHPTNGMLFWRIALLGATGSGNGSFIASCGRRERRWPLRLGVVVTQRGLFGVGMFCRQRLAHGRRFGQARVRAGIPDATSQGFDFATDSGGLAR